MIAFILNPKLVDLLIHLNKTYKTKANIYKLLKCFNAKMPQKSVQLLIY